MPGGQPPPLPVKEQDTKPRQEPKLELVQVYNKFEKKDKLWKQFYVT